MLSLSLSHALYQFINSHPFRTNPSPLSCNTSAEEETMARMLVLFALCVLPALVSARYLGNPFLVRGRVYCDTCRAGFETGTTPGISGARVRIECKDRNTLQLKYSIEGVTDSTGTYSIMVTGDRGDDFCDAALVSSPQSDCAEADPGRDRARVILTRYNGLVSDTRFANALGFFRNEPMSDCTQLLQKYKDIDA